VVEPSLKRQVMSYLKDSYEVGISKCAEVVRMSRSSWYYSSKKDDAELIEALLQLAEKHPTRGFDNYYNRLVKEGYKWSRSKVLRVWSMDFMSDSLSDGRTIRVLNVMDDYNRESLLNKGSISYPSQRVLRELEQIIETYGKPKFIRTDNGPEFRSEEYDHWMKKHEIQPVYTEPGNPMQNGYIERLNRTFREDVLDAYEFDSVGQFNIIAERWQEDYNDNHPHQSLQNKSPREYAQRRHPFWGLAPKRGEVNSII